LDAFSPNKQFYYTNLLCNIFRGTVSFINFEFQKKKNQKTKKIQKTKKNIEAELPYFFFLCFIHGYSSRVIGVVLVSIFIQNEGTNCRDEFQRKLHHALLRVIEILINVVE
jgi:hypothetical protein